MELSDTDRAWLDHLEGRAGELTLAVEALIFAADEPVSNEDLARVFAEVTQEPKPSHEIIASAVSRLNATYEAEQRALRIQRWAGGYRMTTAAEVAPYLKAFFSYDRRKKLSRSLMETLAILAYRQPATKPEIDFVRGVDSDYALRKLLEIGLVDVAGRSDSVGRPLLYGTTPRFLEDFGIDSLENLPNLRQIDELLNDPAFDREKTHLLMLKGFDLADQTSNDNTDDDD